MAALQAVAPLETGTILNDHYLSSDYSNRRCGFLGRHPDYMHITSGLFVLTRRDATLVFGGDSALSVQEVRRRELAHEIDPLLPLPTTDNTETLDDFRSYPDEEWYPGMVSPPMRPQLDDSEAGEPESSVRPYGLLASTKDMRTTSVSHPSSRLQSLNSLTPPRSPVQAQSTTTPALQDPSLRSNMQSAAGAVGALANTDTGLLSLQQTDADRRNSHRLQHHAMPTSLMSEHQSPRTAMPTIGQATSQRHASSSQAAAAPQGEILRQIIDGLGQPTRQATSSLNDLANVEEGVSALAGRGINKPVKTKRGSKRDRAALESPEAIDSVLGDRSSEPARSPVKKLKLKGPRDPTLSPPSSATEASLPPVMRKATPKKKDQSTPTKRKPAAPAPASHGIEAVITGKALPKDKAEAKEASRLRHDRLLVQYQNELKSSAARSRKTTDHGEPDLMPEFFNPANFPPGEEEDTVRCVCGVTSDDSAKMLSCDECNVWQHNACMGDAVPKNLKTGRYHCQVCDPWAHRVTIARLRREARGR